MGVLFPSNGVECGDAAIGLLPASLPGNMMTSFEESALAFTTVPAAGIDSEGIRIVLRSSSSSSSPPPVSFLRLLVVPVGAEGVRSSSPVLFGVMVVVTGCAAEDVRVRRKPKPESGARLKNVLDFLLSEGPAVGVVVPLAGGV